MGEKEAVALMRGVTHDERVESELSSDRKEEQEEVMLAGMRMLSVEFAVLLDWGRVSADTKVQSTVHVPVRRRRRRGRGRKGRTSLRRCGLMSVWVAVPCE